MKERVLLSIVVPIKNQLFRLPSFLNRFYEQNDTNFELIFIDASTDGSYEYLLNEQSKMNNLVVIKEFGKINSTGNARNIGIQKANGKYMIIVGPDLIIAPDTIKKINFILSYNYDSVMFPIKFREEDIPNTLIGKIYFYLDNSPYYGICKLKFWQKVDFNPSLSFGEDRDYARRLRRKYNVFDVHEYFNIPITIYSVGIRNFSDFFKRYFWYGKTSYSYFLVAPLDEKLGLFFSWISLIFPIFALIIGLNKFARKFNRVKKFLNLHELAFAYFFESLSVIIFSLGWITYVLNPICKVFLEKRDPISQSH